MTPLDLEIVQLPVAELVPYAGNARTHSEHQVGQIAKSIRTFGFTNPILIGADGVIIAGHGRLYAAQSLGLELVPTIRLGHLTPIEARQLVIQDNQLALNAGWDMDMLRFELSAIQDAGVDLAEVGFGEDELANIMSGLDPDDLGGSLPCDPGDPDHVPELPVRPVSQRGWIWQLGNHRVMCGDSTSRADMDALVDGVRMQACWTDPPYNVDYEGTAGKIQNDAMSDTAFRRFLTSAFLATAGVMKKGAPIYVAHADTEGFNFRGAFKDAGFKLSGCLIWVKPSLVLGRSDYQWRHEPILYGWKAGAAHRWFGGRAKTTVFDDAGEPITIMPDGSVQIDIGGQVLSITGSDLSIESVEQSVIRFDKPRRSGEHPTMKPVGLISVMLGNSSARGDWVLDPFGGSGSTLIACEQSGRKACLMELDEKFVDVIVSRWEKLTGREAVLVTDGRKFQDLRERAAAA